MEWEAIRDRIIEIKVTFDKSYKCLSQNRDIQKNTVNKHANILVESFNEARQLIYDYRNKLKSNHWSQVCQVLNKFRENLLSIKSKHNLDIIIPTVLNTEISLKNESEKLENNSESEEPQDTELQDSDINNLTIPAIITLTESLDVDSDSETNSEHKPITMAQTTIEFIKTASSILSEYDGKAENLQSFKDALNLVDSLKGEHEATAISLIKTKLKGHARNLISDEKTIAEIIAKLSRTVKGESVEVLSAKLLNLQQKSKTALIEPMH